MKTEIINVLGKGTGIFIYDFSFNEKSNLGDLIHFKDMSYVNKIAGFIREGRKISAIKEIRAQSGLGLKEAKEYIDKFYPTLNFRLFNRPEQEKLLYKIFAQNFINYHMKNESFLTDNDFKI